MILCPQLNGRSVLTGLAAGAEIPDGVNNLYGIKQRSRELPLAICVAEVDWISRYHNLPCYRIDFQPRVRESFYLGIKKLHSRWKRPKEQHEMMNCNIEKRL